MAICRNAREEDIGEVYSLICELENDDSIKMVDFERIYLHNLGNGEIRYVISEYEDKVVGFGSMHLQILLHHLGKVAEIQELIVRSGYQSLGIGGEIVEYLKSVAKQNGCELIEVCCNRKREKSHLFYEKEGFLRSHFKFTYDLKKQ